MVTAMTPFALHQPIKRVLWRSEAKDTFPTTYKMNTRRELVDLFCRQWFRRARILET